MELELLDAICTEICSSQINGWFELSSSQVKSLNDPLLNSFIAKTPETRTNAILWFVKLWTLPKDRVPNSQPPLNSKKRRSRNQHTLEEFCISFFDSLLKKSGEVAFDLCQGLATGVNPKLKWENGEAMILCLDTLLLQSSRQWADHTSLGLLPILLPAAEHRSVTIRRIFFSTVFNAGRFLLVDNPAPDVFLQRVYPLLEQGLHDKNATIRVKLHSHLSEMVEMVAFQEINSSGLISILYRLWSSTLIGMLDVSKSVRSKTLETVKRVMEVYLEIDNKRDVVFTWLHHLHGDLISLLIQQLIAIIIARPDSSLSLKPYQKMAQEILCVLIKIPVFQSRIMEGGLTSRSPVIQSVFKDALAGLPGSVLLEHGVQWLQEMNRIDAEERVKAFIRMLPDSQLNAFHQPSGNDWSLLRVCLNHFQLLCTDPPSNKELTLSKTLNTTLSVKILYTSIKKEKTGIEEIKILSVLNETLLVLMNLKDNHWIVCLMLHWILQTLKIILKRQQQNQMVDQFCQSLLEVYLRHHSIYPCLIQSDFIETMLISSGIGILLPVTSLRALKGHSFLNVLATLHHQKQRLERCLTQMHSKKSDRVDWIFSLAFSPSSPLFIQFQAIKVLMELVSFDPSLMNSIVEMIVKTLESDQSDERSSWMCRIGIYACNRLMKSAPDSHKSTLSSLIVPLCHYIPQQGQDMQTYAFSVLGQLCLQFGMLGGFLTDSLLIKTMINGLISQDIHVKEIVQYVLEKVFQMDSKRIPRLMVELFYQVDVQKGVTLSHELLALWRSFTQSTDGKSQIQGNPSRELLNLYFDFEQPSMKTAILSLLFHIKPTPQSLSLLLDRWKTHGVVVTGLNREERDQWIQFCLNYGPPVQNKEEGLRTKMSDLGSRIQSELLLILQSHTQFCEKSSTGRKQKSEKECRSVIVQKKELEHYAEKIEAFNAKE